MAKPFTFIHAADLHLGTPFTGLGDDSPEIAALLRDATLNAFDNLVQLCIDEEAAFLVIAGDVWDGPSRSIRALLRFLAGVRKLGEGGIPVLVAAGNHDPFQGRGWSAAGELPANLSIFSDKKPSSAEIVRDGKVLAVVQGMSYPKINVTDDLAARFTRKRPDGFEVAVLHATVGGGGAHAPYAPSSLETLRATGIDYWALGHVHTRAVVNAQNPVVCYPGNTQALSVRETGARGALAVEVDGNGRASPRFVPLDSVRFAPVAVDLTGIGDLANVAPAVRGVLAEKLGEADGRALVASLRLVGRSPLYREFRRAGEVTELLAHLREEMEGGSPPLWLDRIENDLSAPLDLARIQASGTLDGEVAKQAGALAVDPAALETVVADLSSRLLDKPVLRKLFAEHGEFPQNAELLSAARDLALDLLSEEEP